MRCRVFIGHLSPYAREKDVERFFKGYGRIREINLKNGFGFVEFEDYRDADDAVYELNGKELCKERVTIEYARSRSRGGWHRSSRFPPRFSYRRSIGGGEERGGRPVHTEYRIIVENLSSRVSWQDLKDLMRQAGEVTFVDAHRNKNEGISECKSLKRLSDLLQKHKDDLRNIFIIRVVEFATSSDMRNALNKLEGKEINGRKIRLIEDRKRRTRSRSHNRSSSRSRSRSPSSKQSKSESRSRSRSRGKSHSASRSPVRKDQPVMNNQAHSRSKSSGLTNQSRSRSRSVESAD